MGSREIARLKDVTANSTKKLGKAGPRPWEIEQYIYQEEPRDDQRSSHDDPRLECLSLHQDDFIPFDDDGDHGSGYPACGLGAMPDLHASTFTASELGTLAGGSCFSTPEERQQRQRRREDRQRRREDRQRRREDQKATRRLQRDVTAQRMRAEREAMRWNNEYHRPMGRQ